ncbi:MAG: F0F1 ATP synthase subunit alpha [Dehalococcoidia bacterium]|jgi:F-type H+-transporting ATPase subunit alpha|nr:MAG: F-type H+-transporting ATPase subunit alpha [Chloroflexota bacterium]|tara:strand:- start:2372 stop:3883 length:1512 start_codon:yes stop_codon:yes gene_type:complete
MSVRPDEIASILKKQIENFDDNNSEVNVGTVISASDGIAQIFGLKSCVSSELIEFSNGVRGLALNLEEETIGAIILGEFSEIKEGDEVRTTGEVASVPVGEEFIGRVVNALGNPIDELGSIKAAETRPVEKIAPDVVSRKSVDQPLQTGIKAIDAMIPIGRGQRELIIGDRSIGKTAIAIDAIINQKGQDVICVYVAIGQKDSKIAQIVASLQDHGAMDHTIVVNASAAESAALQYLAPYAGCAMAEYFMDQGKDVLVVYDDLSKHAWAYRQISLLLRRPPGREAYPGDVFYLHSRLLERAARVDESKGGGSITALPIIETQAGDVSAYIPTNVISITDGQIVLEQGLFNAGQRPATNPGISVSRVGGSAQTKAMKKVAGTLRLDLSQYRELQAFAQFGTDDLDATTKKQLERGARLTELLKQKQYSPKSLSQQVSILYAGTRGFLDKVPIEKVGDFEEKFDEYMASQHRDLLDEIESSKDISEDLEKKLEEAIKSFQSSISY